MEIFAKPAVGAIIEKTSGGVRYLLLQERRKENGLTEIPAGKIREYENIFTALRREVREETGLTLTSIQGEARATLTRTNGYDTLSFSPFCVTQNLCGGYSLLLQTFLFARRTASRARTATKRPPCAGSPPPMLRRSCKATRRGFIPCTSTPCGSIFANTPYNSFSFFCA